MDTLPSEALAVLSGVTGSLFTLVGVWITNKSSYKRLQTQLKHERKLEDERNQRERLEEIYILTKKHFNNIFSNNLTLTHVMEGKISYNDYLDKVIGMQLDYDPQRLPMLMQLYFKKILPEYEEAMKTNSELNRINEAYKHQYKQGFFDGTKYLEAFTLKLEELSAKATKVEEKILETSELSRI